ncbi:MAG: DUF58 domain-containing protein [Chloroflexi bacterium]|nr:DUF58 domain-containing protein [Chloroflexota bacterium]
MIKALIIQHRRKILFSLLILAVLFYSLGTGFSFFYRLLFTLVLLVIIGYGWAWLNLRGLEVRLTRLGTRGRVGDYLEGQIQMINRARLPKSWLEVVEDTDLAEPGGRTVALVKGQVRSFRIATYLARRGIYRTGQVRVTARDPFGLFRLSRTFLNDQSYTVLPRTVPLPDLDRRFANLPSDSVFSRRTPAITPESSTVRDYAHGDSLRRIHWPYTARMNRLMVKEFDIGVSAQAWILLDMERRSHVGEPPDNTEELAVTVAASLVQHWDETAVPVGLAANSADLWMLNPDRRPAQLGILMETLAGIRADGSLSLERFIYDLRPHLSGFNTLMVITASRRPEWTSALVSLRRQGINVTVCYVDPTSFTGSGGESSTGMTGQAVADYLAQHDIPIYVVRRDEDINHALSRPLTISGARIPESSSAPEDPAPVAGPGPVAGRVA